MNFLVNRLEFAGPCLSILGTLVILLVLFRTFDNFRLLAGSEYHVFIIFGLGTVGLRILEFKFDPFSHFGRPSLKYSKNTVGYNFHESALQM